MPSHSFNVPVKGHIDLSIHADAFANMDKQLGPYGKLLVRPSGTEPVLRTYSEADSREKALDILNEARLTIL